MKQPFVNIVLKYNLPVGNQLKFLIFEFSMEKKVNIQAVNYHRDDLNIRNH